MFAGELVAAWCLCWWGGVGEVGVHVGWMWRQVVCGYRVCVFGGIGRRRCVCVTGTRGGEVEAGGVRLYWVSVAGYVWVGVELRLGRRMFTQSVCVVAA